MKSTTLFNLLLPTAATAATLPRGSTPYRLLHTFGAPSTANAHLLAASTESTKGGANLALPSSNASASTISSVHAVFRVPHAKPPTTGPTANNPVGVYAASFWVGIDSAAQGTPSQSCGGALRAGIDVFWDGTVGGEQNPFAWYQFAAPGGTSGSSSSEKGFDGGFAAAAGDVVRFTLSGAAAEEVVVLAENFGANVSCADLGGARPVKSARQVVAGALCGREAAWAVEDFPLEGRPDIPVAFADFGSVAFSAAGVELAGGEEKGVDGAQVLDVNLQAQGGKLTECEVVGGKKVQCKRVVGGN